MVQSRSPSISFKKCVNGEEGEVRLVLEKIAPSHSGILASAQFEPIVQWAFKKIGGNLLNKIPFDPQGRAIKYP